VSGGQPTGNKLHVVASKEPAPNLRVAALACAGKAVRRHSAGSRFITASSSDSGRGLRCLPQRGRSHPRVGRGTKLVEPKDIQVPKSINRAMASPAEAEREKRTKSLRCKGESMPAAPLGMLWTR